MTERFPDPIKLPETVEQARKSRCEAVTFSIKIGFIIRLLIIIMELAGVVWYGSASLLLDALATCVDVISSILLIVFIKLAERPPDDDHPFGHGRYEPLAGLHLGLFLVVIGVAMVAKQSFNIYSDTHEEVLSAYIWIIPAISIVLLEVACRYIKRTAKNTKSPALNAEAAHFRVDIITSFVALFALIGASLYPSYGSVIDHIGAIVIALMMIILGINASRENLEQLMDKKPKDKFFDVVKNAALRTVGVEGTEKIRIQLFGPDAHVSIDVEVDPQLSVYEAHQISQHVRAEIQKDWPAVRDVIVHIEPFYHGDH